MRLRHTFVILLTISVVNIYLYLRTRTVGTIAATTGDSFVVEQYWNGGLDGFITDVIHTDPQGRVTTHTLDADDDRYQAVPLRIDEPNQTLHVELSQNRNMHVPYADTSPKLYQAEQIGGGNSAALRASP